MRRGTSDLSERFKDAYHAGWQARQDYRGGQKCERCWLYCQTVGHFEDHPTLCSKCTLIVRELIRRGTIEPDNETQRWWAENDLSRFKKGIHA